MGNVAGLEGLVGSGGGGGSSGFGEDAAHSHSYGIYGNNFALAAALAAGIGGAAAINPMVSRRGFLRTVGITAAGLSLARCAPYVNAQSNQWRVLDESDKDRSGQRPIMYDVHKHLELAPNERAGIDFQFDGMHNVEVMSPTWAHVISVRIDRKNRINGVFLETPLGHFLTMGGLDEIFVQPDDWITPATIVGTEGNKTRHAQGLTTQLHTHFDEPLHEGIFGKGVQRYTDGVSGYEKEVRNPHRDSITGRVETSIYDGRILTLQDIIREAETGLDNLGRKYSGEHVGQLLNLSKDMGLRFFARLMVLYQAQKYGLIANPDFQRDAAEYLADYRKNSKAMIFLIYRNPELKDKDGKEVYHKPEGPIDRMERVAGLKLELDRVKKVDTPINGLNHYIDGRNYRQVIDAGQRLLRASPAWEEFSAYWDLGGAYTWRDKNIAIVYALAAIGMAEQKWGRPLKEKPRFYDEIKTIIANSYGKMGMQIEKTSFENSFKQPT